MIEFLRRVFRRSFHDTGPDQPIAEYHFGDTIRCEVPGGRVPKVGDRVWITCPLRVIEGVSWVGLDESIRATFNEVADWEVKCVSHFLVPNALTPLGTIKQLTMHPRTVVYLQPFLQKCEGRQKSRQPTKEDALP